ncbi:MAG: cytochrome P450 [Candidatus Binataceae bacterium]
MEFSDVALTDPEFFAHGDPHAFFKHLRATDPVHWTQGRLRHGFWSVTRYEDALRVYRDARTFSSERYGVGLPSSPAVEDAPPDDVRANGKMLVITDPPRHDGLRRLFRTPFLPRPVTLMESRAREIVAEIVDQVAAAGQCDFVLEFATRLPMAIICEMMEIPKSDWGAMFRWGNMALGHEDPEFQVVGDPAETQRQGFHGMGQYGFKLATQRRGDLGDDLISLIANGEIDGQKLSDAEVSFNCQMFVIAGLETTRNAISGGMLELLRNPDQFARLAADHSLMPTAVEEILRWTSPITHIMRAALRDAEIRGRKIREGDWVVIWNASANRDEEVFANPDRFDIARKPNYHIAFGYGEHFCLGAHLARLELRPALDEVMRRIPDLQLAGEVQRLSSNLVAGIKHMPVRFTPKAAAA